MVERYSIVRFRPSIGFLCAAIGIALTIFSWYGPWAWPAWPAFAAMDVAFGSRNNFAELSYRARSIAVVVLIAWNSTFWALLARAGIATAQRLTRSARVEAREE